MGYITIEWNDDSGKPNKEVVRHLIQTIGHFSLDYFRDIRVQVDDLKRYEKRVNDFIEKHLKTDLRVKIPLIEKDKDDIKWCEARIDRKIDFDLVKT